VADRLHLDPVEEAVITATDERVWEVTCDRCGRPDWPVGVTEADALSQLRTDGWSVEPMVCPSCQADEVPREVLIADAIHSLGGCGCDVSDVEPT
jgi:hypothetical protein